MRQAADKPGWKRRALYSGALVLIAGAGVELSSCVAYSLLFDESLSPAEVRERQRDLARTGVENTATDRTGGTEEVIHPYLGFVSSPASENELVNELRGIGVSSFGFNDDKSPLQPAREDALIVGIFGGSVAHYFSLQGIEALERELQRVPRYRDRELVVVRTALAGWKQPQQFLALSYLLALGAHFDLVLNLDGFNEVTLPFMENMKKGVYPPFPRNWFLRTQGMTDRRVRLAIGEAAHLREARAAWARRFAEAPWARGATLSLVWRSRDRQLANGLQRVNQELLESRAEDAHYVAVGPPYAYGDAEKLAAEQVETWARSSLQMDRLARANGIAYFHFLQPNQYLPGAKPLHARERGLAWSDDSPYKPGVERGYPLLRERGGELSVQGVRFFDLTGVFADHEEPLYHDVCCHVNERGNELLGQRIGEIVAAAEP